jgi:hypothetical protein
MRIFRSNFDYHLRLSGPWKGLVDRLLPDAAQAFDRRHAPMNRLGRRSLSTLGAVAAQPGYLILTNDANSGSRATEVTDPNHETAGLGLTSGNVAIHPMISVATEKPGGRHAR